MSERAALVPSAISTGEGDFHDVAGFGCRGEVAGEPEVVVACLVDFNGLVEGDFHGAIGGGSGFAYHRGAVEAVKTGGVSHAYGGYVGYGSGAGHAGLHSAYREDILVALYREYGMPYRGVGGAACGSYFRCGGQRHIGYVDRYARHGGNRHREAVECGAD